MVDGFINFNLNEKTPTIIKVIGVGGGAPQQSDSL